MRRGVWFAESQPHPSPCQCKSVCSLHFRFRPSTEYTPKQTLLQCTPKTFLPFLLDRFPSTQQIPCSHLLQAVVLSYSRWPAPSAWGMHLMAGPLSYFLWPAVRDINHKFQIATLINISRICFPQINQTETCYKSTCLMNILKKIIETVCKNKKTYNYR